MVDTPAYQVLRAAGALCSEYRIHSAEELDAIGPNSEAFANCMLESLCFPFSCFFKTFEVPAGNVTLVEDGRGSYEFRREGVHMICDPFYTVGDTKEFDINTIVHGDRVILVVEQGYIGLAMDKGEPVLLGPGLHQWQSQTLQFVEMVDLNSNVIRLGPMTLVTVDEGYEAITEDNGLQKILEGGTAHLLMHRNWKFQKFVSKKINSDDLKHFKATSADNVVIDVGATVMWRVTDVETAGVHACETILSSGGEARAVDDVAKLRGDVLNQAEASLAAYIGSIHYSARFGIAAQVQGGGANPKAEVGGGGGRSAKGGRALCNRHARCDGSARQRHVRNVRGHDHVHQCRLRRPLLPHPPGRSLPGRSSSSGGSEVRDRRQGQGSSGGDRGAGGEGGCSGTCHRRR